MIISIQQFIEGYRANRSNYAIPEFQRKFTWKNDQIESFFDSIIRQYPIPRFFVWQAGVNNTVGLFYFSHNVTNRPAQGVEFDVNDYNNQLTNIICDGQQRLTSLIIGFTGLNASNTKVAKYLYFNIFSDFENIEINKFKFLSNIEAQVETDERFFIKVSELYQLFIQKPPGTPLRAYVENIINQYNVNNFNAELVSLSKRNIEKFITAIINTNYLDLQDITHSIDNDLTQAVEFFMRINEGGTSLTQNQILFSLISRYLHLPLYLHITLRTDFDTISNNLNYSKILKNKNKTYDFFLRCALYTSTNSVLFKASRFDFNNCSLILNDWPVLFISIQKVLDLIVELNLDESILSINSLIPIIYHHFKKNNYPITIQEKKEILKYLVRAQFSKSFGSHGDTILVRLKSNQSDLYVNANYQFTFNDLNHNLPTNKSFNLNEEDLNQLLELKYGNRQTRAILNLIYSHLIGGVIRYHVDHIHPQSICKVESKLLLNNVFVGDIQFIKKYYDKLPNLQLLKNDCNLNKSNIPILDWINTIITNNQNGVGDLSCLNGHNSVLTYIRDNKINIPNEFDNDQFIQDFISIENFKLFYNQRRKYLFQILWEMLGDPNNPIPNIDPVL